MARTFLPLEARGGFSELSLTAFCQRASGAPENDFRACGGDAQAVFGASLVKGPVLGVFSAAFFLCDFAWSQS